jgi:hypothetical protein
MLQRKKAIACCSAICEYIPTFVASESSSFSCGGRFSSIPPPMAENLSATRRVALFLTAGSARAAGGRVWRPGFFAALTLSAEIPYNARLSVIQLSGTLALP